MPKITPPPMVIQMAAVCTSLIMLTYSTRVAR